MREMHDLIELVTGWFSDVQRLDESTLKRLMKMGSRVQKVLEFGDKVRALRGGTRIARD